MIVVIMLQIQGCRSKSIDIKGRVQRSRMKKRHKIQRIYRMKFTLLFRR